jgi:hypothetical protein
LCIVFFNNGKIGTISTPADCHVGMIVTVKFNNKLKIALLVLAAVLLVGIGIFIGVSLVQGKAARPAPVDMPMHNDGHGHMMRQNWW